MRDKNGKSRLLNGFVLAVLSTMFMVPDFGRLPIWMPLSWFLTAFVIGWLTPLI